MPRRKKNEPPWKKSGFNLLSPDQAQYLMESLNRSRIMLHGEEPKPEEMVKVTEWASTSMINKALLSGVFMGGLDIDIDENGEVTFVPAIQLNGMLMPNGGGPH